MTNQITKTKFYQPLWLVGVLLLVGVGWLFLRPTVPSSPAPTTTTTKVYQPVVYPVKEWEASKYQPKADSDTLKMLLGDTATTAEALDFYGGFARQYRYSAKSEAPLYVIDSRDLFEVAWYYASSQDDEITKQMSISHAKRAYQVMSALYGKKKSVALMQEMLDGKSLNAKARALYPKLVAAGCQDYMCRLVITKQNQ